MATYYVPSGNWTSQVVSNLGINPIDVLTYNVSIEPKPDPAVGCRKEFNAEYKCGKSSSTSKNVIVSPEALGRTARFDCATEYTQCNNLKLVLTDDGKLTLTTLNGTQTLWDSVTAFGANGKMPTNSETINSSQEKDVPEGSNIFVANPAHAATTTNTTNLVTTGPGRKYDTNYLVPGQLLEIGQWIGSPSGTCRLIMKNDGLQVIANELGCDGLDENINVATERDITTGTANATAAAAALQVEADRYKAEALKHNITTYSIKDLGCWNDTSSRALKGGPQRYGYSVASCSNEAKQRNSKIFALQNNGWCSTSDSTKTGDNYSKYGRSPQKLCNPLGGKWQNHVYEIIETPASLASLASLAPGGAALGGPAPGGTATVPALLDTDGARLYEINTIHKNHLGKVGYINYLGQLQLFPDTMTQYVDSYEKIGNYNIDGAKLEVEFATTTVEECQNKCSSKNSGTETTTNANGEVVEVPEGEKCAGFVFDTERKMCQLLNNRVTNSNRIINPNYEFYMRGKGIKDNHPSCSINTTNKNSIFWESTVKSTIGDMSDTSKCGLAKFTESERDTVDSEKEIVINDIDNTDEPNFKSLFDNLKQKYKFLINGITNTNTTINNRFNELKVTKKDLADWTGEQLQNLEAMDDDTDLNMMSQNYRHIMWSILAIIIIITTIKLTK